MQANEVRIRNVDAAAIAKIDELAAKRGMSRNAYLKQYIENLAVLEELKELDNRYASLVNIVAEAMEQNTAALNELRRVIETREGCVADGKI